MSENRLALQIDEIRRFLPHRFPFLLVDRVLEIHPKGDLSIIEGSEDKVGTTVKALKNITYNEPCFTGHFPDYSIFPGVLTLEAMAQAASFAAYPLRNANPEVFKKGLSVILLGIDGVRFRKPIIPGDTVIFDATLTKCRRAIWALDVIASVNGQKVAEASLLANLGPQT